jgi:hypothetical protein
LKDSAAKVNTTEPLQLAVAQAGSGFAVAPENVWLIAERA